METISKSKFQQLETEEMAMVIGAGSFEQWKEVPNSRSIVRRNCHDGTYQVETHWMEQKYSWWGSHATSSVTARMTID